LDAAADLWDAEVGEVHLPRMAAVTSPLVSDASAPSAPHLEGALVGTRVAIARDDAFCFLYEENLAALKKLGASLVFFSPLSDDALPACDALYLPGGYPELHAPRLAEKRRLWRDVAAHVAAGRPLVAECGGLMVLARTLVTLDGRRHEMAGVLDLEVQMEARIQAIGPQEAALPGLPDGPSLRGHTFHCSRASGGEPAAGWSRSPLGSPGEAIFHRQRLVASYVHWYLPSSLEATVHLFRRAS
jgi:cobyrinic acid a,c-diamide synthase